jgi:hypothetical protein
MRHFGISAFRHFGWLAGVEPLDLIQPAEMPKCQEG